jgi:hypothetical protein
MAITKATASSVAPAAKGDLVVGSATNDAAVLGVGSNDQVLTADSSTATGLKWAAASSGGMTSLASGSLSGTSLALTSISGSYKHLQLRLSDIDLATYAGYIQMTFMGITSNYTYNVTGWQGAAVNTGISSGSNVRFDYNQEYYEYGNYNAQLLINIYNYADSTGKLGDFRLYYQPRFSVGKTVLFGTFENNNSSAQAALTSITLSTNGDSGSIPTFNAGTYVLYGVS